MYRVIDDEQAAAENLLRVVDESGEDYAFASNRFHVLKLPSNVEEILLANGGGIVNLA